MVALQSLFVSFNILANCLDTRVDWLGSSTKNAMCKLIELNSYKSF